MDDFRSSSTLMLSIIYAAIANVIRIWIKEARAGTTLNPPHMSATDSSLLSETLAAVRDITKLVRVNRISDYQYQEAGFGGSADIFWWVLEWQTWTTDITSSMQQWHIPSKRWKGARSKFIRFLLIND